jgi:ketosteroid isomerase-like protein
MKIHIIVLVIFLISCIAGCAAPATQPPAQPTATQAPPVVQPVSQPTPTINPQAQIVLNMVERLNAGDVDGSLGYFAEDALSYFIGMPPTGIEYYTSREALRPMWEYCVSDNFEWEVEITEVEGDLVFAVAKTWLDFTRQLGVAPNEFIDIYQVQNGKITTYGSTMTEAALARFKPAFSEVMPPEPTAIPTSFTPVSEMIVTIADGACITDNPVALQSGQVMINLRVKDTNKEKYALTMFTLDEEKDLLDLMASTARSSPPSWANTLLMEEIGPDENATYSLNLESGPVYLICWSQPPALPIGNAGPIVVVP